VFENITLRLDTSFFLLTFPCLTVKRKFSPNAEPPPRKQRDKVSPRPVPLPVDGSTSAVMTPRVAKEEIAKNLAASLSDVDGQSNGNNPDKNR
jgi:hypothetical protein